MKTILFIFSVCLPVILCKTNIYLCSRENLLINPKTTEILVRLTVF